MHIHYCAHSKPDILVGESLLVKIRTALKDAVQHKGIFDELDERVQVQAPELLDEWQDKITAWEKDPRDTPCPYEAQYPCKYSFWFGFLWELIVLPSLDTEANLGSTRTSRGATIPHRANRATRNRS
jgi:hypothetical protein